MRQFFILLVSSLFCLTAIQAQDEKPLYFGTSIGAAIGTPIGPAEEGATGAPGVGLHAGILTRYYFNDKIGLQIGLNYSSKKAKYDSPANDRFYTYIIEQVISPDETIELVVDTYFNGQVEGEFSNQYLGAPIDVYYRLNDKWTVLGGVYFAYLLRGKHDVYATGIVGDNFLDVDNEYSDESFGLRDQDYGFNAGINFRAFNQIEAELRITTGLTSIFRDDYPGTTDTIRNVYLELKANYLFTL